jgi:hypothetical protein
MGKTRRKTYRRKNTVKKRQNRKHRYVKKTRLRKALTNRKTLQLKRYKKPMKGGYTWDCKGRQHKNPECVDCQNVYDDGIGVCNTPFGCPTDGAGWYKRNRFGHNKPLKKVLLEGQFRGGYPPHWYKDLLALDNSSMELERNDLLCPVCDLILHKENSVYYIKPEKQGQQLIPKKQGQQLIPKKQGQLILEPHDDVDPVNPPSVRKVKNVNVGVKGFTPREIHNYVSQTSWDDW